MGLAAPGEGFRVVREGIAEKSGRLPVNPSGGLKSKGHPVGATGVSMHVMACLQLMNEASEMQIDGATIAGVFNMGGAAWRFTYQSWSGRNDGASSERWSRSGVAGVMNLSHRCPRRRHAATGAKSAWYGATGLGRGRSLTGASMRWARG